MRKRATIFAILMCGASASQAQRPALTPWLTGERLIRKLTPVDPAGMSVQPQDILPTKELAARFRTILNREFYEGYVSALHDATEGTAWCYNQKYKTPKGDTLLDETRYGLHRLSAEQLKRNASELLIEMWREKWPCPTERRNK